MKAEIANGVASQIRILRQQREWSQDDLARLLGTSQAAVSRLEDPSYGKYSLATLRDIAATCDVALAVRFVPFSTLVRATWNTAPEHLGVLSYDADVTHVMSLHTSTESHLVSLSADDAPADLQIYEAQATGDGTFVVLFTERVYQASEHANG